jgi:hypothetical protein
MQIPKHCARVYMHIALSPDHVARVDVFYRRRYVSVARHALCTCGWRPKVARYNLRKRGACICLDRRRPCTMVLHMNNLIDMIAIVTCFCGLQIFVQLSTYVHVF